MQMDIQDAILTYSVFLIDYKNQEWEQIQNERDLKRIQNSSRA